MGSRSVSRGSGPENSTYDKQRHESMRLRQFGLYGVVKSFPSAEVSEFRCETCYEKINSPHIIISGRHFHKGCFKCV
jgi:hypothetical protein